MMRNRKVTQLLLEDLSERWQWLMYERGISELKVTESFKIGGTKSFIVTGIQMDFENEFGFCYDCYDNEVLTENNSTLLLFLKENVTSVILVPIEDGYCQEYLTIGNKTILIEKAS